MSSRLWISGNFAANGVVRAFRGLGSAPTFAAFSADCFLFCLTGASIFDNRHGLLKKFDSAGGLPVSRLAITSKC